MPRYKNGELLETELPKQEEQPQQQESAGRIVLPDGTTTSSGVYNAASNQQANTGMVSTAAGQNTNRGDKRTPLTYTGLDGETKLDPRGASAVLTQVAQSQMDEPTMQESERTRAALERLENWDQNRVGAYTGRYDAQIDQILGNLGNREGFSYNPEEDQLYRNYRDLYLRMGNRAMQDSMANSAALTGGYGNSYGAAVGQQQYQDYVSRLNEQLPNLYDRAYQRWQDEGNDMYQRLGAYMDMDSRDYGRYRDQVSDWQNDRAYYANRYDTETGNDMSRYDRDLAQWQADRDYYYNMMMHGMMDDPVTAAAVQSMIAGTGAGGGSGSGSGSGSGNGGGDRNRLSGKSGNDAKFNYPLPDLSDVGAVIPSVSQTGDMDALREVISRMTMPQTGGINPGQTFTGDASKPWVSDDFNYVLMNDTEAQRAADAVLNGEYQIPDLKTRIKNETKANNMPGGANNPPVTVNGTIRAPITGTTGTTGAGRTTGTGTTGTTRPTTGTGTTGGTTRPTTGTGTTGGTTGTGTTRTALPGRTPIPLPTDWTGTDSAVRVSDDELVKRMRELGITY